MTPENETLTKQKLDTTNIHVLKERTFIRFWIRNITSPEERVVLSSIYNNYTSAKGIFQQFAPSVTYTKKEHELKKYEPLIYDFTMEKETKKTDFSFLTHDIPIDKSMEMQTYNSDDYEY